MTEKRQLISIAQRLDAAKEHAERQAAEGRIVAEHLRVALETLDQLIAEARR